MLFISHTHQSSSHTTPLSHSHKHSHSVTNTVTQSHSHKYSHTTPQSHTHKYSHTVTSPPQSTTQHEIFNQAVSLKHRADGRTVNCTATIIPFLCCCYFCLVWFGRADIWNSILWPIIVCECGPNIWKDILIM